MKKTLQDVACYLKEIMVPEAREAYAIHPAYTSMSDEQSIWGGVLALRSFLLRLYDVLSLKGKAYDNCKKAAHEYENRTTLSVYYPFLHHVSTILINIGYYGLPAENPLSLICGNEVFPEKLSAGKTIECLQFLADCGIRFEGMDIYETKQHSSAVNAIKVTYPDNPAMLTGLKVMAIAQTDHRTLLNQDVLLRCDWRILKKDETDVFSIVQDTIRPLPSNMQGFVTDLHQRCVSKGMSCAAEVKGFHTYIKYGYKSKDVWGINASLNNGYHINVKPAKAHEYADAVTSFHPALQALIAKGYGCGRKRDIGHCDGGCRGITLPLDDSVLNMRGDIESWFDHELLHLKKK